ncbi:MAG: ABC transporter permease, partial [Candidatus Diapherotrites archaeon]
MKFTDLVGLAVNSILHRRLRSWLTLLGIVIGVAAVVAILSLGEGARASIDEQLSSFGADIITVTAGSYRAQGFGGFMLRGGERNFMPRERATSQPTSTPKLNILDSKIIASTNNVKNINELVSGRAELAFLAEKANVSISGVNPNTWKEMSTLKLATGRLLNSSDSKAIVIGHAVANEMFKQPITLGRRVAIGKQTFTVVGILAPSGMTMGGGGNDRTVFMPYKSAWEVTDVENGVFSSIQVQVEDVSKVDKTVEEITSALLVSRKVTANTKDFTVTSAQSIK